MIFLRIRTVRVYGDGSGAVATVATAGTVNNIVTQTAQWAQLGMQVDVIDGTTLGNANPTVKGF